MADIFPGATQVVQLVEWGYPMGSLRPTPAPSQAYSVVHITANLASAQNEAAWRKNDPGLQNSATFFINPDGSVVQTLGDPLHMDPWTNGDAQNPDMSNPRIAAMMAAGVNPNERSLITMENVGREPGDPITAAQENTCAAIIAYYHPKAGLPINRETVIGHYQINSVNRINCPSTNKSVIDRIVAKATGGTVPVVAEETDVLNQITYPWPRDFTTKAGDLTGYKYSDEPNATESFAAGSSAQSSGQVDIIPPPDGWLPGPYQWVHTGPLKGFMVANSQINLGPLPAPLPAPPAPAADITALTAQIASIKAILDETVGRVEEMEDLAMRRDEWFQRRPVPSILNIRLRPGDWTKWYREYPVS